LNRVTVMPKNMGKLLEFHPNLNKFQHTFSSPFEAPFSKVLLQLQTSRNIREPKTFKKHFAPINEIDVKFNEMMREETPLPI